MLLEQKMRRPPRRPRVSARLLSSVALCGAGAAACGGPTADGDALGIVSAPLSADTEATVFALGRTALFHPWGGEGTLTAGPPPEARVVLREVPEGDFQLAFAGYARRTFAAPDPPSFPTEAYCLRDVGDGDVHVVSGQRGARTLTATPTTSECVHTALDRYAVDPDYAADPAHPFFGSPGGENVVAFFVDDWGPLEPLLLTLDSGGSSPFGVFAALPDTAGGAMWPDPADWNMESLSLTADANGDASGYLVARPGALPALREVLITRMEDGQSARLRVWIAPANEGPACAPPDCDDANACTTDTCDPAAGCVHAPLPDGTVCGSDMFCRAGQCVPGAIVWPVSSLTGDCGNDGTATTSFAQMRCGNDAILGDPPLEVQRYAALTFDLSSLPVDLDIDAAELRLYQEHVYGDGLFTPGQLESIVAEHVSFTMLFGGCDTWAPIPGTIGQVPVSSDPAVGWRSADITDAVRYGLDALPRRVQIRLRFVPVTADGDGQTDLVAFSSDNTIIPAQAPFLRLYYPP